MTDDARFEDAAPENPLRLRAETAEDLQVISALLQDAVVDVADVAWMPRRRRFALVANRFRWEDKPVAEQARRDYERVRAGVQVNSALSVRSQGVDPSDKDTVLSILSLAFEPGEDGAGTVLLTLAGDGEIAVEVECLDVAIDDISRPWIARNLPEHPDD